MLNEIPALMTSTQKLSLMIRELMENGLMANVNDAFVVLRACLLTVRDRIDTGEAVQLGGQLTPILRGYYYEDWNPTHKFRKFRSQGSFLQAVQECMHGHGEIDLEIAVPAALKVILRHIDEGEAREVIHCLPKEVQDMCH